MRRRSGQKGQIVRKGSMWHVRFYVDVPGQLKRQRTSVPVGPAVGKEKLTRPEAARKAAELIASFGVNTPEHLERARHPKPVATIETFRDRVEWCRKYHKAWTDGKPGPVYWMDNQLDKHVLPVLGDVPLESVNEIKVQEFVADLKRATFQRRKPDGTVIKSYRLSRKSVLNIVGIVKLILGRKVWMTWELNLGKPQRPRQRYFTEDELCRIIGAAPTHYRVLFALLAATGMRIGEAAGLHREDVDLDHGVIYVRRSVYRGQELPPKTENAVRQIDIDPALVQLLSDHIGDNRRMRVFESCNGTPISSNNIRKRVLQPLLAKLGIENAGLHAFRHARVTILRKRGMPADLQLQWIGHSSLKTTDRYSHTDQELEYRRQMAARAGLGFVLGPNNANWTQAQPTTEIELEHSA